MMNDTLAEQLKFLRLPGLLAGWDAHLKAAAQSNLSHARLLTRVVEEEYRLKCDQARQQRLAHAKIPERWVMDTFPFDRQPKLSKKKIMALYDSMAFLADKQNILWMGGTGCGNQNFQKITTIEWVFPRLHLGIPPASGSRSSGKLIECLLIATAESGVQHVPAKSAEIDESSPPPRHAQHALRYS